MYFDLHTPGGPHQVADNFIEFDAESCETFGTSSKVSFDCVFFACLCWPFVTTFNKPNVELNSSPVLYIKLTNCSH